MKNKDYYLHIITSIDGGLTLTNSLYHYCSIETLELILQSRKIRFSSLGVVDDMEEPITSDYDDIGRICFVSCWTDLIQESVEMWRTYTGGKNGVRIGLPRDLFERWASKKEEIDLNLKIMEQKDLVLSPPYFPQLIPITYTKDEELINLSVLKTENKVCEQCGNESATLSVDIKHIGRFKREYWSGQSEWRFRLIAVPKEYYRNNEQGKYLGGKPQEMVELMKSDLATATFKTNYIDFPVDESIFSEMDILLSPLNTKEDNEKVLSILRNHTKIKDLKPKLSELKIRSK